MSKIGNAEDQVWLDESDCVVQDLRKLQSSKEDIGELEFTETVVSDIPVYDGEKLRARNASGRDWRPVMAEWNRILKDGPGVICIKKGHSGLDVIDQLTEKINEIILEESAVSQRKGDHFAASGENGRLWNAHEKLCMRAPEHYIRYIANPIIRAMSEAWLGPNYQVTAQANIVRPGGKSQVAHRDYHMGFMGDERTKEYPVSQHQLSASLTLQGAIAHSDMPLETGPTKFLPYSQKYVPGYLAILQQEFRDYFEEHHVQIPLEKGDMVFFNPALFHAAGENTTTDKQRVANLFQIGSAFGRSIEIVDRARISKVCFSKLLDLMAKQELTAQEVDNVIAATAEGYSFPANLDIESPTEGMAPRSQQDLMRLAIAQTWPAERFETELDQMVLLKRSVA